MKDILVLRLGHRVPRDARISTHVALVARAFGARALYYTGTRDKEFESNFSKIVDRWGGEFKIFFIEHPFKWLDEMKAGGYTVIHLTMYGININDLLDRLVTLNKFIVIVGGEKVPRKYFEVSDYNIAIGHQPHSEVAALAIFLDRIYFGRELDMQFPDAKHYIIGSKRGKYVVGDKNMLKI